MWAALRSEPMVAKSVAAEVIISGAAITYDISHLRHPSSSVCLSFEIGMRSGLARCSVAGALRRRTFARHGPHHRTRDRAYNAALRPRLRRELARICP